jgi:hypothetical protein
MDVSIPGLIIICGLQGGGKSHLIRFIMHENQEKFDWGLVFSNTGFAAENFDYVDKRFVHAKYDEYALSNLKSIHEQLVEQGKKPSGFVIFDDCLFDEQWKSKEFRALMTQLRHYKITCIISCQYPHSIEPLFRSQVFQVAMFFMTGERALMALYKSYGQMFDSYNDFKKYLLGNTGNHQFIWFNARNGATSIDGRYQIMKCPETIPDFQLKFKQKI